MMTFVWVACVRSKKLKLGITPATPIKIQLLGIQNSAEQKIKNLKDTLLTYYFWCTKKSTVFVNGQQSLSGYNNEKPICLIRKIFKNNVTTKRISRLAHDLQRHTHAIGYYY
jgi:hypothetical protein